ncbi:uncharacterized protein MKK02DRAFT_37648 [Dioszegia hungarica]|uniref:Uncharacterized protein n=1 Tax=Dioszegia hungarica TaxID=4972 RepID=A0AA38LV28_9TREE|nr:uncharacterized protein MKK02DRAFT_37648 [Dioszegia hungarica]KAI9634771.1 hypothetical protein MKK02DRAFT_37648 [Dioszegia hungarica]
MSTKEVPPHLWPLFLPFLRKPVPPPLSKAPRSEWRQHDLAVAMRVSNLFHAICEPYLYTHIVTDEFNELLGLLDSADARVRIYRRQQVARTRSLYLEYIPVEEREGYHLIFALGGSTWPSVGAMKGSGAEIRAKNAACAGELATWVLTLWDMNEVGLPSRFPSLETLANASIGGERDPDQWTTSSLPLPYDISAFATLPVPSPYPPRPRRPLSTISPPLNTSPPSIWGGGRFTLLLGVDRSFRWVGDLPATHDWKAAIQSIFIPKSLDTIINYRTERAGVAYPSELDVDVYLSTTHDLDADFVEALQAFTPGQSDLTQSCSKSAIEKQRKVAGELGTALQGILREGTERKDMIRWHVLADAPTCGACGSGVPT